MNPGNTVSDFEKVIDNLSIIQQVKDIDIFRDTIIQFPYFQTAQLLYIISKNQIESIFSETELKQAAIYSGSRTKLYEYLSTDFNLHEQSAEQTYEIDVRSDMTPISSFKVPKEQADALIDKFIQENPSIQKPNAEFYSPSAMAAKSLEEDSDIVSETYAKILVKTGKYVKAIRIYEKLMLYYPEKSNYFASLIESLKDKINE
jgi:tetratricopeptide (TPR) repeat protein